MAKKSSGAGKNSYANAAMVFGMLLSCMIGFYILFTVEDALYLSIFILVGGMCGSIFLPSFIIEKLDEINRKNNRQQEALSNKKKSDNLPTPRKKVTPHVLNEPVPEEAPSNIYTENEIRMATKWSHQWNARTEQMAIQLLQKFKPEQRPHARQILKELDRAMDPSMVLATLLLSEGEVSKLKSYAELANMDYRDLLSALWLMSL